MSDLIADFHTAAQASGRDVGLLFEDTVQRIYEAWLKPGDIAVDVGAHKGRHLFPMLDAVGPTGKVYAFEPLPTLFKKLRKRLKQESRRNVKLVEKALGAKSGKTRFSYFERKPAFSGLQRRPTPFDDTEGGLTSITVKCTTLDRALPLFRRVSAIKLDIEGGELHALMGARQCLKRSRPLLIFENGRQQSAGVYGYSADDFFGFFRSVDMPVFWLSGEPFEPADWQKDRRCWEFIALPAERADFADRLPDLCREVIEAAG